MTKTTETDTTFYIYSDRYGFILTDGEDAVLSFASEAEAIDAAVRIAQDVDALYTINYWKPEA